MPGSTHALSKSRFVSALQCTKRLYLETHHRELASEPSIGLQRIFDSGHAVGELAQKQFPEGRLIDAPYYDTAKALRDTEAAIEAGVTVLYEPAFLYQNVLVRVDILRKGADGRWHLIEVKSTNRVSDTHIADVAIQRYVTEGAGLPVASCYVMHLNRECRYPDLSNLFVLDDVTEAVAGAFSDIGALVTEFTQILLQENAPDVPIGAHCTKPYECPFKAHCWSHVREPSIFTIPRLNERKISQLVGKGITAIADLPETFPLSENQRRYVTIARSSEPQILWPAIADTLRELAFPLYFLDFETMAEPVPRHHGLGPYWPYPFQYSLHVMQLDGTLEHREYLHPDGSDPRAPLAEQLLSDIPGAGTIVAYNASFEKRVISDLATHLPRLRRNLRSLLPRFFDLLPIFRDFYIHPEFRGSASIKGVLPVLVPELSYATLEVQSGDVAQVAWLEMLSAEEDSKRLSLAESLKAYCTLDTLAMVRIYEVLIRELRSMGLA